MRVLHGRGGRALSGAASAADLSVELAALFARDLARWRQEIEAFPDTPALWRTAPGVANAAGTLALHLDGNLREYVGRRLGGLPYGRDRGLEFSARGVDQAEIVRRLEALCGLIPRIVAGLTPAQLDATYPEPYDGALLSTRQFVLHLYGHAGYHLGQVNSLRRLVTAVRPAASRPRRR